MFPYVSVIDLIPLVSSHEEIGRDLAAGVEEELEAVDGVVIVGGGPVPWTSKGRYASMRKREPKGGGREDDGARGAVGRGLHSRDGGGRGFSRGMEQDDEEDLSGEGDLSGWRDGELESEMAVLEQTVADGGTPSLDKCNGGMLLCCKAVYKGLGMAGVRRGLSLLSLMHTARVTPNQRTYDMLLDACVGAAAQGSLVGIQHALTIVDHMCAVRPYLTQSVHIVVWQKSIPAQIRRRILHYY